MKYSKLIQKENYPTGDCFRTVLACILNKEQPEDIPNFMRDGNEYFDKYFEEWLLENNLEYIELTYEQWENTYYFPDGLCGISGKSPRGDYDHIVVGEIKNRYVDGIKLRDLYFRHDTSPYHDGVFIDGYIKHIGVLVKKV